MPPHLHYVEPYAGGAAVLLAKDPTGVSEVINDLDGPLGFNFSFLENRCDLLLAPELTDQQTHDTTRALLAAAAPMYEDFPPGSLLVTTDARTGELLQRAGAELIREYAQSIWLREVYEAWYRHVELSRRYEHGGPHGRLLG